MVEYIDDHKTVVLSQDEDMLFMHCQDRRGNVSVLEVSINFNHELGVLGYANGIFPNDLDSLDQQHSSFAFGIPINGSAKVRYDNSFLPANWDQRKPELHYAGIRLLTEICTVDGKSNPIKELGKIVDKKLQDHNDPRMIEFISILPTIKYFEDLMRFYSLHRRLRRDWKKRP